MPNRILREGILTSRRVDRLSERAELFYRRVMSRLDDYGRCEADAQLLRSSCYPLRVDRVKPSHIDAWLVECQRVGLLVLYESGGKRYLQFLDWRQQTRSESKYPPPAKQLIAAAQQMIPLQNNAPLKKEAACAADAKQVIANAHLGVVGGVVVDVDVYEGVGGAPPRKGNGGDDVRACEEKTCRTAGTLQPNGRTLCAKHAPHAHSIEYFTPGKPVQQKKKFEAPSIPRPPDEPQR